MEGLKTLLFTFGLMVFLWAIVYEIRINQLVDATDEQARIERATFWAEHPYAARWLVKHGRR